MTGKDKTEDQLLSSIRKNKPAAAPSPAPRAPAKKTTARKTTAARTTPKTAAEPSADASYSSGRRVWPD
ncbi:MAG: hypothetical protein KDJ27_09455 [Gammaproteobacteria bacterium]|nr:hypothetical protein [Gammaproteobacteria bacterium]MCB1923955.1 hypothetical protein [Gammaproteobacteria bacterium]